MRLVEAASKYAGELVLVATGPLTNIALACKLDSSFAHNGTCMLACAVQVLRV